MPQALRHVIPNLVNSFISLFRTLLVSIRRAVESPGIVACGVFPTPKLVRRQTTAL